MLHSCLYVDTFDDSWLDERFLHALRLLLEKCSSIHVVYPRQDVFTLPVFSQAFCKMLCEEISALEESGQQLSRPNNMAYHGVILEDVGMRFSRDLAERHLFPFAAELLGMNPLKSLHSFVVSYGLGRDKALDPHIDDSTVTFNVCLSDDCEGSQLLFCGNMGAPEHRLVSHMHEHTSGQAVAHYGHLRHSALPITAGVRRNLILWLKEEPSVDRRGSYQREARHPDAMCVSFTHDVDYFSWHDEPPLRGDGQRVSNLEKRAWCPPEGAASLPS